MSGQKTIAEALAEPGVVIKREEVLSQIDSWISEFDIESHELEWAEDDVYMGYKR